MYDEAILPRTERAKRKGFPSSMADSVLSKHSDSDSDSGDSQLLTRKKGTQHALTTMSQLGQKVNTRCIIQTAFIQRMQWNHAATKNGFGSTTDFIQLGPCFGQ